MLGPVDSGRIYATHLVRVLLRAAEEYGTTSILAKWTVPLLLGQLNDKCRAVVIAAADILDEATDDPVINFSPVAFSFSLIYLLNRHALRY